MKTIILACLGGVLLIAFGGYSAFQSVKQDFTYATGCVQMQDMNKKVDSCTQVISVEEGTQRSFFKIQSPDLPSAYLQRGFGYSQIAKYDEARRDFNKAIELQPDFAMAYNNLGALDLRSGDLQGADTNVSRAIDLDPKLSLAWNNRCWARMRMARYPEALDACTHAIELDPKHPDNYLGRGDAYFGLTDATSDEGSKQKDYDNAMADFDAAIKISPSYALAYNERCRGFLAEKDYTRATTSCETAISLQPDSAPPYANRGLARMHQDNMLSAITDFDTAIRLDPKLLQVYGYRSQAYQMTGDFNRALENSQAFLAQVPNDASGLSDRGISHFALGNFHAAAEDFTAALSHDDFVYRKLWRYLSLARAGEDGGSKLAQDAKEAKDKSWPYPVVEFYLGQRSSNDMIAAAGNDDQRCEATFYLGEWYLLHNNTNDATALLQKATDTCPKTFVENMFAKSELKRLSQPI